MDVTETTLEDFGYIDSAAGDASGASAVEQVLASRRIADCARDILRRLGEVHGRSEVVLNEHPEELLAKIVTEANEPLQAQRSGGLDLPRAAANARRIWHLLHALEEWYQKEDRTAMILADFHCICESMDNHAELTHGEEVLAARESGMCAKEILRLLGEVPEGPCELNLTGGPNDLLTRMFAEATEPLQAERNGDLNFVDAALNARRILHLSRAVEVWYQNEADEAVQLGRDPLVNFHLVARSESRSAGSGYHTLAVTRESGPGPPLASTAGYDLCDLEVENSEGEPVDALVLAATPSVKLSLLSDKDYIKAICKAAQEKQEMCPACCAPLHAEPSDLSGENRSCERCESQLEVRCYRCLECQWTLCKDCQLPPAKQERIRRWASLVAIPPVVELGGSPLHLAVAEDNFRLAQRFEALINARDRFAQTPLHHAASEGNKQIANWLLDQRADLNAKSKKNITPLYKAVKKGHREVASLFLERGANIAELANCLICSDDSAAMQSLLLLDFSNHVKSCNFNGQTLLHSAAAAGSQLCARALLKHKACSSQEQQKANHSERTKEKEQLASSVFDTNVNIRDQDNRTPLHSTPAFGHDELARTLVKEFDADVNARDKNNRTPLHLAAAKGHTEVVRLLLKEFDADVNASDKDNLTPLYLAVLGGHSDIAMLMLRMAVEKSINSEAGEAKPTFVVKDMPGRVKDGVCRTLKLLHFVAADALPGTPELARLLVEEFGADVNAKDEHNATPLHLAAAKGHTEVARLLVEEFGADVNARNKGYRTPLHVAAAEGHTEVARLLVKEFNADVNARDKEYLLPLHVAALQGHTEVYRLLVKEFDADVSALDEDNHTPLHFAAANSRTDVARLLVEEFGADVNARDEHNATPLHLAAAKGRGFFVFLLVQEFGADVNARDNLYQTPLHVAAAEGHTEVARLLVKESDVNARDKIGRTPVHVAAAQGHSELARLLMKESGADLSARE